MLSKKKWFNILHFDIYFFISFFRLSVLHIYPSTCIFGIMLFGMRDCVWAFTAQTQSLSLFSVWCLPSPSFQCWSTMNQYYWWPLFIPHPWVLFSCNLFTVLFIHFVMSSDHFRVTYFTHSSYPLFLFTLVPIFHTHPQNFPRCQHAMCSSNIVHFYSTYLLLLYHILVYPYPWCIYCSRKQEHTLPSHLYSSLPLYSEFFLSEFFPYQSAFNCSLPYILLCKD